MDENGEILRFQQKFSREEDMAPIEHILIGSGIPLEDGEIYNFEKFSEQFREDKIPDEVFIPKGVKPPVYSDERRELLERRRNQKELKGALAFLEYNEEEWGQYMPYLELNSLINDENGKLDPVWYISLMNRFSEIRKDKAKESEILKKITLAEPFKEFFELTFQEEDNLLVMELKSGE